MTPSRRTTTGIAYERAGPRGAVPVLLLHAGVADRRMWDPIWSALTAERDAIRLDLRGFGESTTRPVGAPSPVADVLDTMAETGIDACHVAGASFGAGVAVEVTLTRPDLVASLLLAPPGGSLLAEVTPDLRAFADEETAALAASDLDRAVEANLAWWVDGVGRDARDVDPVLRERVGQMQRRAFEITADWGDVDDVDLDPPALDRLGEIDVPTLVLVGSLDLLTTWHAAHQVVDGVADAELVRWPDTAHLPTMERPAEFAVLLREWLARCETGPRELS